MHLSKRVVLGVAAAAIALTLSISSLARSGASESADEKSVSMIPAGGESQKYWSRWRGPSGQGLVEDDSYPTTWSDTRNVVWKADLPGSGNSSPIIWGDQIFLTTAYEDGQKRSILSFRRSDGQQLWESFGPQAPPEKAYPKNGHASSTVATDGERVYAYLGSQGLLALDMQGRTAWHADLGDVTSAFHGTAGSPLLFQDRVILYQDLNSGDAFVAAYDKRTGRQIWRTPRTGKVGWGTPIAIRAGDREEIVVSSNRVVISYNPDDGSELWRCAGNTYEVIPTPVVGHGLIFCTSGRAGPTLAIRPGGSGDVSESHLAWRSPKGSPFVPSPMLYGDYLYMINDLQSILTCYRAQTGELVYQERLGLPIREGFSASPVAFDGKIFFTNDQGQTFVIKAGPEFELLHVNELNERVLASPALVDGKWYFRTASKLLAIGD